ncbi:MAG TPA: ABC transporter ATP-binding protein [Bacilli bacterium]|nr:ABC transporter ATP-binding protein [Bacilli bacterium]
MADIELQNVIKIYGAQKKKNKKPAILVGKRAVDEVSIKIPSGSFTILVGPSGCGKTTLLRMIAGLEEITSGIVKIGEIDVTNLEPGDRGLAMVFQNYALYPHMSVKENIEFGLVNARIPKFEIKERVFESLKIVGLEDYQDRKPGSLSGGQRQRVALARAIAKTPQCFLMDEPLSNLDAKLRSEMRTELIQLHQKLMSTFVYVTHDQIEAMTMGDNIIVMNEGKIKQQGSPSQIHNDPNCVFVAKFIGDPGMNIIAVDEEYSIGFRPRDVQFDIANSKDENSIFIKTKIVSFENHGSEFLYLVEFNTATAFVKELSKHNRKVSSEIAFSIAKQDIYVFTNDENRVYDQKKIEVAYGKFKARWENI